MRQRLRAKWILAISFVVVFAVLLAFQGTADAAPIELYSIDLTYRDFFSGGRSPLITYNGLPDRSLGKEVALQVDMDVLSYGFFKNRVHGMSDEDAANGGGQFRTVGWEFEFGLRVFSWVDCSYYHHSQHVLDLAYPPGFPVEDAFQIRFHLFERRSGGFRESFF